jgi:AAA domain/RepB DNA-primase from phage plasmid/Primase C terminal 2 (PriCT-2)
MLDLLDYDPFQNQNDVGHFGQFAEGAHFYSCPGCPPKGQLIEEDEERLNYLAKFVIPDSKMEARRFLAKLDPDATYFTFQTFDDDAKRKDKTLARILHGTLDQHWKKLCDVNRKGAGVYITVNATDGQGRTAKNITRARALFTDLDGAPLEPVLQATPRPHIALKSSPGKFHCYWLVEDIALEQFEGFQKALAARFGGDPAVCDLPRVLRLPGFWHRKGEPYKSNIVRLHHSVPAYRLADFDWLEMKANGHAVADDARDTDNFANLNLEEVAAAMRAIPNGDDVDRKEWVAIGHALKSACPSDEGLELFKEWSARWTGGEYDEQYTVDAWDGFNPDRTGVAKLFKLANEASPGWREAKAVETKVQKEPDGESSLLGYSWRWRWHGEVEIADSRPYLIQSVIPEVGTGILSGQWGTHKTFLGLDLAAAVMSGKTFIEFPVRRKGGVLFIACEGESELAIRLTALVQEKYPDMVDRVPFAWVNDCPRLLDSNASKILTAMVEDAADKMMRDFELPVAMVIFDTAGKAAGFTKTGEENDAATNAIVVRALTKVANACGLFVLGIDHFGKDASVGTRGTSGKEGNTDVILAMLGEKDIEGRVTDTRLCLRKRRDGPNGQEFPYKTRVIDMGSDQYGAPMDTLVLEWLDEDEAAKGAPRDAWGKAASLRLLRTCLLKVGADFSLPGAANAPTQKKNGVDVETVRQEFYTCYLAEGTPEQKTATRQKAFRRAVTDAQKLGLIELKEQRNGITLLRMLEP